MSFKPTPEQEAIVEAIQTGTGSIDVDALAGAAKSTTLQLAAQNVNSGGKCLALAFNVSIKKALEAKLPSNFDVLTLNGLGHRAWQRFIGGSKLKLEQDKLYRIIRMVIDGRQTGSAEEEKKLISDISAMCNGARAYGLVPNANFPAQARSLLQDNEEGWATLLDEVDADFDLETLFDWLPVIRQILVESINQSFAGNIDFADQIYMPCMFNGPFPRYSMVFVDEAQDLSPLNHIQVQRSAAGRLVAVGDERQSIYAFRGADPNSIPILRQKFKTKTYTLTTTFRCAKALVRNVHWRAPNMQAAEWAPEGEIIRWNRWSVTQIKPGSAVLCRNNAPLMKLGFQLLRQGVSVTFVGGDLSRSLIGFIRKIADKNMEMSSSVFFGKLDQWLSDEIKESIDRRQPKRAERAADKAEIARALPGKTVAELITNLQKIFDQPPGGIVTLSSGHRSKGLEWEQGIHLSPHLIPSPFAESDKAKLQEDNLRYVMDTRFKEKLIYANADLLDSETP